MSIRINIDDIDETIFAKIRKDTMIILSTPYTKRIEPYDIYRENDGIDYIIVPFYYSQKYHDFKRPKRDIFPSMLTAFTGELRPEQVQVEKEALKLLNSTGCSLISTYTGFGKSIGAIRISCIIKLPTLIVVNKIILMKQWKESISKFCPDAKILLITPKTTNNDITDHDFYIINAINIEKFGRKAFRSIGTVIVDEVHLILAEKLARCMQCLFPRYLIGLSATPYRPDGLDKLFDLYFGPNKVIRKLHRKHIVYRVDTGFKPVIEKGPNGRINWNSVLESQADNVDRNNLIIKIVKKFHDRIFIIPVKRISQGEYLLNELTAQGESVTSLLGSNQEFNKDARILIGTLSKIGTGFDHARLNTLLLATDVQEYFIQYLGRIFRTQDSECIVFDLLDNSKILMQHYLTRKEVYETHGGIIKKFPIKCLDE